MLGDILKKVFGSANDRRLKTYRPKVAAINAAEAEVAALSDEALRARTPSPPARPLMTFSCPRSPPCARRPSVCSASAISTCS